MAVLLLVFMGVIGLAAMDTVTRDRQVAGFARRSQIAFYAAEAGAHTGLDLLRDANRNNPPALPSTFLGNAADYPVAGRPQFQGDPAQSQPIRFERAADPASVPSLGMELGTGVGRDTGVAVEYWTINAQGTGPGGSSARIEVGKRRFGSAGYGG